ncbi:MAG: hypothetical protein V1922_05865 [bacterium]
MAIAMTGGEGEKANVTGKDLAAAIAPNRGRAPVLNKEVAVLRERYLKDAGKSVFQAELEPESDKVVNFDEMHRVLDSEQKRVDAEKDPKKHDVLKKRYDRLELQCNIYDKLLNNEGLAAMDNVEQQTVINTMANLPGFAESASVAIGGRLSVDQMMKVLNGKGGVVMTRDEKKALSEIIQSMANDDRFKNRLSKSLSTLTLPSEDAALAAEISTLQGGIRDKAKKEDELKTHKAIADGFETKYPSPAVRESVRTEYEDYQEAWNGLQKAFRPLDFSPTTIAKIKAGLEAEIAAAAALARPTAHVPPAPESVAYYRALNEQLNLFNQVSPIISDAAKREQMNEYKQYSAAKGRTDALSTELAGYSDKEKQIIQKESDRGKYVDKYKRKIEIALNEEMKRYWNEVTLDNATKAAEARAAIKGEEDQGVKDLAEKRVKIAGDMLERFTQLSYLRYEGGEAKGWDDKAIKDFVHKDMLSRSPKQLSRDMLDRIIRNRGQLPRAYGKEIDALLKDMGVGAGTPPATAREVLNTIDASEYQKWAEAKIPDMLGYAKARGYYFDLMKFKPGQAEFLLRAYDEKFFANATDAKTKYAEQAARLMGGDLKEFIDGGSLNWKKVKEALVGKNWPEGMKKMMKYLAYAGAGYVLGGGFIWDAGGRYIGLDKVLHTLSNVGSIPPTIVGAASRAGDWAINAPAEGILSGINGIVPRIVGGVPVGGRPPIPPIRP